jgi:putative FmdB family regulatory protein
MPLYDFECQKCNLVFETFAKYEENIIPCENPEKCDGQALKQVSAPVGRVKGSSTPVKQ